jgi:hypothetical protein
LIFSYKKTAPMHLLEQKGIVTVVLRDYGIFLK